MARLTLDIIESGRLCGSAASFRTMPHPLTTQRQRLASQPRNSAMQDGGPITIRNTFERNGVPHVVSSDGKFWRLCLMDCAASPDLSRC
ncbi:hypothetical protein CEXT_692071 [Caerostris extrusa]|uniref:Uncharacterized protein n=1 Tax=Caerostris extrusa TaxID=172846 RepID=A0AAV4SG26_CAEEX|nr:hypothetical protein CEXT_692071 [Caerostris extrusa]